MNEPKKDWRERFDEEFFEVFVPVAGKMYSTKDGSISNIHQKHVYHDLVAFIERIVEENKKGAYAKGRADEAEQRDKEDAKLLQSGKEEDVR